MMQVAVAMVGILMACSTVCGAVAPFDNAAKELLEEPLEPINPPNDPQPTPLRPPDIDPPSVPVDFPPKPHDQPLKPEPRGPGPIEKPPKPRKPVEPGVPKPPKRTGQPGPIDNPPKPPGDKPPKPIELEATWNTYQSILNTTYSWIFVEATAEVCTEYIIVC
ncbi:hypothetical protein GOP47_0016251 [Adiantum capillus-veneris]|uniref:Proline-rich protein n=1 Tax=Adiantum capillus-veneris TaxID=13818 RepID=A0A9D4UIE9_ADICA|nr:hypothetical protein GOP47_0016251 [Adiantum capillus-veneris]